MGAWIWIIAGGLIIFFIISINRDEEDGQRVQNITTVDEDERQQYYDEGPEIDCYWDEDYGMVPTPARLRISYIDARGQMTERTISVSRYNGSAYIDAYCELRGEHRTFRIDRMQEIVSAETGEIIDDLPAYLLDLYKQSHEYILSEAFSKYLDILKVLFYVGKSDGQLRKDEREIICAVIRKIAGRKELEYDEINRFINRLQIPSPQGFKLAFGRVCKNYPKHAPQVYAIAKKIIDTQKTVHHNEEEALAYMRRKMQKENIVPPEAE